MYLTFQKSALKVLKCIKKSKKKKFQFAQKGVGWGCLISSQNPNERLLILSPPSKWTVKQKKVIFFWKFLLFKILDEFVMGIAVF
jgi:hypothetical protein